MTNREFEVTGLGLAVGGECVAESSAGQKKFFVAGLMPGERARVRVLDEQQNFYRAQLVELLQTSEHRVSPPCRYFGACGGCDYQFISTPKQRSLKREMIELTLERHVGFSDAVELIGGDLPDYGYRSRVALHLDTSGRMGFYKRGTGEIVDLEECLLLNRPLAQLFMKVRPMRESLAPLCGGIVLEIRDEQEYAVLKLRDEIQSAGKASIVAQQLEGLGIRVTVEHRGERLYEVDEENVAGRFSQVNAQANELLVAEVCRRIGVAEVTELYAGAGNFTVPLARQGCEVAAVELDGALVEAARTKLTRANLWNAQVHKSSVEKFIKSQLMNRVVLLDPPRSGAREAARAIAASASVDQVVYVSCSLPTLVRDLKDLMDGAFKITGIAFLDMFPQTHHVEIVTQLNRRPKGMR